MIHHGRTFELTPLDQLRQILTLGLGNQRIKFPMDDECRTLDVLGLVNRLKPLFNNTIQVAEQVFSHIFNRSKWTDEHEGGRVALRGHLHGDPRADGAPHDHDVPVLYFEVVLDPVLGLDCVVDYVFFGRVEFVLESVAWVFHADEVDVKAVAGVEEQK